MTGRRLYPEDGGVCVIDSCERPICAKWMCRSHYRQSYLAQRMNQEFIPKPLKSEKIKRCRFCTREATARDLCVAHYRRWRMGKIVDRPIRTSSLQRICSVEECNKKVFGYGYCRNHYNKFIRASKKQIREMQFAS